MRIKREDLIGKKIHEWTVLGLDEKDKQRIICRCSCGTVKSIIKTELTLNRTKSCQNCCLIKRNKKSATHNMEGTRLYHIWSSMKARCSRKANHDYCNYGERGISVCDEWLEFIPFMDWSLSHGYNRSLTIDRIDGNGNYEPSNCRWVTNIIQQNNKRNNHLLTNNGKTMNLKQWSIFLDIPYKTLKSRVSLDWDDKKILETPVRMRTGLQGR